MIKALVRGGCVIRVSIPYVYNLSEALNPLSAVTAGAKKDDVVYSLYYAHSQLRGFLYGSVWTSSLKVCVAPGQKLIEAMEAIFSAGESDRLLEYYEVITLTSALSTFKTILEAEFQTSATYLVTDRRGYDIGALIERAEVIFPEELIRKVPAVLFDLREAGKCIAFNLGTGAGFHLLRALETVICAYWGEVMEGKALPSNRNLGAYINGMETAKKGDGKVLAALRQIKDHHRNSLVHPEERLDLDQAIALLGIVQSAIVAMLPTLKEPETPEAAEAESA